MEHALSGRNPNRRQGALIVARDALIFLMCMLIVALIYLVSPQTLSKTFASETVSASNTSVPSQSAARPAPPRQTEIFLPGCLTKIPAPTQC